MTAPEPDYDGSPAEKYIPASQRPALELARVVWRHCWPGMELDGSADLIVLAMARAGYLKKRLPRPREAS